MSIGATKASKDRMPWSVPGPYGSETERGTDRQRTASMAGLLSWRVSGSACQWSITSTRNGPWDTFSTSLHEVLRFPLAGRVQHPQHDRFGRHVAAGLVTGRVDLIAGGAAPRERRHQQ